MECNSFPEVARHATSPQGHWALKKVFFIFREQYETGLVEGESMGGNGGGENHKSKSFITNQYMCPTLIRYKRQWTAGSRGKRVEVE